MARKPILPIRLDEETKARWKTAADLAGLPLAEFVRRTVDDVIAHPEAERVWSGGGPDEAPPPPRVVSSGGKAFKGMDPKEGRRHR